MLRNMKLANKGDARTGAHLAPALSLPTSCHACVPQKSASEKARNGTAAPGSTCGDRRRRFDQPIAGCDRPSSVWRCDRIRKSVLSPLADNCRIHFTVLPGATKRRQRVDPAPSTWLSYPTCFAPRVEQPPSLDNDRGACRRIQ